MKHRDYNVAYNKFFSILFMFSYYNNGGIHGYFLNAYRSTCLFVLEDTFTLVKIV